MLSKIVFRFFTRGICRVKSDRVYCNPGECGRTAMSCAKNTVTNMEPGWFDQSRIMGSHNKSSQLRIVVGYKGLHKGGYYA
jgi:hypothetical protein